MVIGRGLSLLAMWYIIVHTKENDVMTNEPRPRGRPRTRTGYRQVHLYVPAELLAVIDAIVARKGISRNAAVIQLLTKAAKPRTKKGAE